MAAAPRTLRSAAARGLAAEPAATLRISLALVGVLAAPCASTQTLHVTAAASAQATYTSNVDFGDAAQHHSDFVASVIGTFGVSGGYDNLQLNGTVNVTALVDGRGNFRGTIAPTGTSTLGGTYKAIDNFLYVDASATWSQNYLSPFGARPRDLVNDTSNRYTSQAYNLAPYVRGVLPGNIAYLVRDQNTWTTSSSTGSTAARPPTTYSNIASANLTSNSGRVGWVIDYNRSYYDSGLAGGTSLVETLRAALPVRFSPEFTAGPRVGYERDKFLSDQRQESVIYGAQAQWTPTPRTLVDGYWEHRFFGTAYGLNASHRLPRIALTANFTRDLTNYPQLALTLPATENVANYVDAALRTRIPDATERAAAVQRFLASSGLPTALFGPVDFFSTTFLLQTSETFTATWLGLRDSVAVTAFRVRSRSITEHDQALLETFIPEQLRFTPNNTQIGAGISYSHSLSPVTTAVFSANGSRVRADAGSGDGVSSAVNTGVNAALSTQFTPRTTGTVGTGYTWYSPSGGTDLHHSTAWNIYAAVTHVFR